MPNPIVVVLVCIAAFVLAFVSDWLDVRCTQAVTQGRPARVASYSVLMWLSGTIGLVAVIEIGWTILPFEALGLFLGSLHAMRRTR